MKEDLMKEQKVTTIQELKRYKAGAVVELPPFASGQPFYARLRRPSMMSLMRSGKIPNTLLDKAQQLFSGDANTYEKGDRPISEILDILDIICESMFLEPTFNEIKSAEIELTDEQYTFLFNYSQNGVNAIKPFYS